MAFQYTQSALKNSVNSKIKGKIGVLVDFQDILNSGVRQVLADLDLLTTRRRTPLIPALFNGVFEYAAPSDLKGYSIISVQNQTWSKAISWGLVPYEQFMRRQDANTIAVSDYDGLRKVFIKSDTKDQNFKFASFDTVGSWVLLGDAENVELDSGNFVEGTASIKFDISSAGGTTAGVQNSALSPADMTEYFEGNGCAVVRAYLTSKTNVTNFILKVGSDSSNYYTKTVTTQADGTAFVNGWNILYFDLSTFTTQGTPVISATDYCALYMTKAAGKISEVGYKFDGLEFRIGEINNLYYYSGYGWQTSGGTYIPNSTASSDLLNAGEEEYELIVAKCAELAADDCDEDKVSEKQAMRYKELRKIYKDNNPSEALVLISTVQDFIKV
jgi:hypothetical protein